MIDQLSCFHLCERHWMPLNITLLYDLKLEYIVNVLGNVYVYTFIHTYMWAMMLTKRKENNLE